jgi:hypothetical protein
MRAPRVHHFRISRDGLDAAGAAALDLAGKQITRDAEPYSARG